ncbi:carboxypeptidase-like regulatory domain-containing protein [Hymenobacter sp. J193]|uniref:carboxypeptidase-like regulatory domain-containing protein n=1 Tax=Hymenobacter sp. J193 TaxID=2898429 RepID=UPI002151DB62|nr:carboxypeptidase-like regulatory domain-containing protein [Hymenobacter sp. J193]MCR5888428.1 carboxypeptidase-like regulatory domain-containing protein [Hymenobacter sp. J193]
MQSAAFPPRVPSFAFPFRLSLLFLLLLLASTARAQVLSGTVTEASSAAGVPYANVGIIGKGIGTVADDNGVFRLTYTSANLLDTVRISSIGYRAQRILLRDLVARPTVRLVAEAVTLRGVQVKAKGLYKRTRTLGNTGNSENSTLTLEAHDLGAEIGTVISLKHKPTKVLNANFNVAYNRAGSLMFRVNLYRLLPNGKPSNVKLVQRDIIVTTSVAKGPITVDLTPDQLVLDEDFFLTLEWIGGADAKNVSSKLAFSASLGYTNNDLYLRDTSQAEWERASVGAVLAGLQPRISFYVTVQD